MKNVLKLVAVAVFAFGLTGCNCFGKMAKNQDEVSISCTPEVLVLNNGKVEADITVKFPVEYYNKKAVLKVTPVIVFEGGEVAGATKYFQNRYTHEYLTKRSDMPPEKNRAVLTMLRYLVYARGHPSFTALQ